MRSAGRRIVAVIDEAINLIVLTVVLALFLFGAYILWDSGQIAKEADAVRYAQYKPTESEHLTFSQLCERNPDVFGWLTVDDTKIDYPVVQGADNFEYINLSAEREFSLSGSIFLDFRNSREMTDRVSIFYGHHMERDNMFGCFDAFADEDFFAAHQTGSLFYNGQNHALRIFAFLRADGYDQTVYAPETSDAESGAYLRGLLELAEQKSDALPEEGERIVLLSTCASSETNGRMILAAAVSARPEPAAADTAAQAARRHSLWGIPYAVWIALVLLVLLLTIYWRHRKSNAKKESSR